MCGIVGYVGKKKASDFLIEGLSKLEYRGYDSAGIAVINNGKVEIRKHKGRLSNLVEELSNNSAEGTIGIGHTRWATHGEPSETNAHPHVSDDGNVVAVHNGIIENYMKLREWLTSKGYEFLSETDTEVIPNLVDYYYKDGRNLFDAVVKATSKLEGSFAIGVIANNEPDKIIAVRKDSPLIVGLGEEESFIASDIPAVLNHTRDVYLLEDKEFVILTKDGVELRTEDGERIEKEVYHVTWNVDAAEKGGYEDFMLKEIHEQPKAVRDTLAGKIQLGKEIELDNVKFSKEELENFDKVYIVACGTAYHAGVVGKTVIEKLAKIPVEIDVASEFRYRDPLITDRTLIIVVSQSGETADTLAVLRDGQRQGARVLAITNVVGSSISRESDDIFYTWAGPEIAVASTKAYTTQLVSFYMIALDFAIKKGTISREYYNEMIEKLKDMPELVSKALEQETHIKEDVAKELKNATSAFYLGRGLDYNLAMEGALKIKEISYIHAEAFAAGELKHGTIALIEEGTPVIAIATQEELFEKMVSNMQEVKARGAYVIAVAQEHNKEVEKAADKVIYIPNVDDILSSILTVLPLQLLSYYVAVQRGCDVDKPRNLAKSVTVE